MATPEPVATERRAAGGARAQGRTLALGAPLIIYAAAVAVYAALSHAVKVPILFPDEFHYGNIAQTIAAGNGPTWRGASDPIRSLLYVYAIAPSWIVSSGTGAYALAKIAGAAMCCLVIVPVWLLARSLVGSRLAIVPALLSVAGTWMATTGLIATENLALPLGTAALCSMVASLRGPQPRWWIAALVLSALATSARLQMGVLFPVFVAALLIDAAVVPRDRIKARLREHRAPLVAATSASVAGLVAVLASDGSALGAYATLHEYRPSVGRILSLSAQQLLALVVLLGFIPAGLVVSMALRPANWRDETSGPVLTILLCATGGFALQSGWFLAGYQVAGWDIERYVWYVAPLAMVAMMLVPGRVSWRTGSVGFGSIALALLATRDVHRGSIEERALVATSRRLGDLGSGLATAGVGLPVAAVVLGVIALLILGLDRGGHRPMRTAAVLGAVVFVVLLVQSQAAWQAQTRTADMWRSLLPRDLEWVDHASDARVGVLNTSYDNRALRVTEFFNSAMRDSYDIRGQFAQVGPRCTLSPAENGTLLSDACRIPSTLLLENTILRPTLYDETVLKDQGLRGRLVRIAGPPRLLSLVAEPCFEHGEPFAEARAPVLRCRGQVAVELWLDEPAVLTLRFRGGSQQHYGRLDQRVIPFAPGGGQAATVPVTPGHTSKVMELDWLSTEGSPELRSVELRFRGGERLRIA